MVHIKKDKYMKLQKKRKQEDFINKLNEYRNQYSEFGMFLVELFNFFDDASNEAFSIANTYLLDFLFILHPDLQDLHQEAFEEDRIDNRTMFIPIPPPFCESLWEMTKDFVNEYDIADKVLFIDLKDFSMNDLFNLFKIFEDAQTHNILFLKNIDYNMYKFFMDYGITQCHCSIFFLPTPKEVYDFNNNQSSFCNIYQDNPDSAFLKASFDSPFLYEQQEGIGFELYNNLREWKKEITAPTRKSPEYKKMKKRVRQRDGNTCQCCGYHNDSKTHHNLEVHHVYGYKDHLDYRTEDSNCITLCSDCHKKYHSLYGKKNVTPFTFVQFIKEYHNYYKTDFQTTLDILEVK